MPERPDHDSKTDVAPDTEADGPGGVAPASPKDDAQAHAGRQDQDVKHTTGAGAGGATEWGGGNANHPSRIAGKPPGG